MNPLQAYFKLSPEFVTPKPHGMVSVALEMEDDPGMTLDVIEGGSLRQFADGDLLIIGAYSYEQYEALDGLLPESFIAMSYDELMIAHPELDGYEMIGEERVLIIPNRRFAQNT